jgi:hypothetical protein
MSRESPLPRSTFPDTEEGVTSTNPSPASRWRKRRQRQGLVRVEVQVRKEDATPVRDVATALVGPEREAKMRAILRERIVAPRSGGFKALLASAPLQGIDLERLRDLGRYAAR